jgi:DNA-binding GntR family transcriptional regulator
MVLESLAARLTTRLATAQELQNIEKTVIDSKQYLDTEGERNRQALIAENGRFHELIIKYSQNRRLKKQLRDLHSLSHYFRTLNFQGENREWIVYNEHQDILAQMKRRDEDKAAFMMNKHLETDLEHLKEIFSSYTKE